MFRLPQGTMVKRTAISVSFVLMTLAVCSTAANAQIAKITDQGGRQLFINAEPPKPTKLSGFSAAKPALAGKPRTTIYLSAESFLMGQSRPAMSIDRDGVERLVREAADRHNVDPALVRAVIETESHWNAGAVSNRGAVGLMQLIPTTAQRFGARDLFNPKQNVDAGVHYLKTLLERYNGNLDLALAAYNAGEGAVAKAHGIPAFRETRDYVQKVQNAYFRPGSGRLADAWHNPHGIHKDVSSSGRVIFTNE